MDIDRIGRFPGRLFRFLFRVIKSFRRNQGLLLSGAVAYYILLSILPMLILALIVLSNYIDEDQLFYTLSTFIDMVLPGYSHTLTEQVRVFLEHKSVIGVVGFIIMLFFSATAFSVFESAMLVIFARRSIFKKRRLFISAAIPYAYMFLMGIGILVVSLIVGAMEVFENKQIYFLGLNFSIRGAPGIVIHIIGVIGEMFIFTSLYLVMPPVHVKFRHAVTGGITAAILWEITRRVLIWYYSALSFVNLIYGSFATAVVALLNIEAVVLILLLGAQVIAELSLVPAIQRNGKTSGLEA